MGHRFIAQLALSDEIEGAYLLRSAYQKTGSNGKPFLDLTIEDRSGPIDAKVWDYAGPIGMAEAGKVVWLRGRVTEFRGGLQVIVERLRLAAEEDPFDLSDLVPVAPIDREAAMAEIERLVASLEDADYRAVCEEMLARHGAAFRTIPAAKSVHHAFLSGLLMHTRDMLRLADFVSGLYAGIVDRSLLLAGTLLHDFGKEREFAFSDVGLVTEYATEGQLLGHLVLGAQEVAEVTRTLGTPPEKAMLLQHMILSHHGTPEFGAAVRPACAESELLSYLDLIDSRMEIYRETLADLPVGSFSGRVFALDGKRLYRHD